LSLAMLIFLRFAMMIFSRLFPIESLEHRRLDRQPVAAANSTSCSAPEGRITSSRQPLQELGHANAGQPAGERMSRHSSVAPQNSTVAPTRASRLPASARHEGGSCRGHPGGPLGISEAANRGGQKSESPGQDERLRPFVRIGERWE
jgi:hypothetical protein